MLLCRIDNIQCGRTNSEEPKNTPCFKRLWCSNMRNVRWGRLPHWQRVGALPQYNLPTEIKYRQSQYHSPLHRDRPFSKTRYIPWSIWKSWICEVVVWLNVPPVGNVEPVSRWDTDAVGCDVRGKWKRAQCFHYAVLSAVMREAPPRRGLSSQWIPEGRIPHLAFI